MPQPLLLRASAVMFRLKIEKMLVVYLNSNLTGCPVDLLNLVILLRARNRLHTGAKYLAASRFKLNLGRDIEI